MGALNRFLCVGIGLLCVANMFHMSGMSTPHWASYTTYMVDYSTQTLVETDETGFFGLFEVCKDRKILDPECDDTWFGRSPMKVRVLQVLVYLGLVFGMLGVGAAIILQLVVYISHTNLPRWLLILTSSISAASSLAATGFIFSANCLFADRRMDLGVSLGYSFFLCLIAAVMFTSGASLVTKASKTIHTRQCRGEQGEGRAENGADGSAASREQKGSVEMTIEEDEGDREFRATT